MTNARPNAANPPPASDDAATFEAALPAIVVPPPGPASAAWLARLRQVESANVTAIGPDFPVVWQRAQGAVVVDVDGNRYLDAGSSFGVALIGHGHAAVRAAVHAQTDALLHGMGDVHPPTVRIELLEALQAVAPGDLGHGVLCTGGSEAVEVALKTALLATGKPGILAFAGGYHGLSLGALGGTHRADFRAPFAPWLPGPTRFLPFPRADARAPERAAAALAATLAEAEAALLAPGAAIGAVLVEPLQGRGGTVVAPHGLLQGLRTLCDRAGALLIVDEIFTGCGRTGAMFACEHEGVLPDLLCVGKALGGGLPIAACLGRAAAMAAWGPSTGEALHTSTFLGHPLASAAALATLGVLRDEQVPQRAAHDGLRWAAELHRALGDHAAVAQIRGKGLMWGIELRGPAGEPGGALAWQAVLGCLRRGVLVLPCGPAGDVLQLTPPVCVTAEQRACIVAALADAIDEAHARARRSVAP